MASLSKTVNNIIGTTNNMHVLSCEKKIDYSKSPIEVFWDRIRQFGYTEAVKHKTDVFLAGVKLDISSYECPKRHCLNIRVSRSQLEGDTITLPTVIRDETDAVVSIVPFCTEFATRKCLARAVQMAYRKFDVNKYLESLNPTGIITKITWKIFRENQSIWRKDYDELTSRLSYKKNMIIDEERRISSIKKAQKLDEEILKLGNGDRDIGLKKWNNRKALQTKVANNKEVVASYRMMNEFNDWLVSDDGLSYNKPFVDTSLCQFNRTVLSSDNNSCIVSSLKVPNQKIFLDVLNELASNSEAESLIVEVELRWNPNEAHSYPYTKIRGEDGIVKLSGCPDIGEGERFRLFGIETSGNSVYGTTSECRNVHRLLPARFHKTFRGKNPFKTTVTTMRVIRVLDKSIYSAIVKRLNPDGTIATNTTITMRIGADKPDLSVIFLSSEIVKVRNEMSLMINKKGDEIKSRVENERCKGRYSKNRPSSLSNSTLIDELQILSKMFKDKLLTQDEFSKSKSMLIG